MPYNLEVPIEDLYFLMTKSIGQETFVQAWRMVVEGKTYWGAKMYSPTDPKIDFWQVDEDYCREVFSLCSFVDHHPFWPQKLMGDPQKGT